MSQSSRKLFGLALICIFTLAALGCGDSRRAGAAGDPDVRVSRIGNAKVLAFLFGDYRILESGDEPSSCQKAAIAVSGTEFRDPVNGKLIETDEIVLETRGANACERQVVFVFRDRGAWTKTPTGDRYEFSGRVLLNNGPYDVETAVAVTQVGGPYLLRIKTLGGSFLLSKR